MAVRYLGRLAALILLGCLASAQSSAQDSPKDPAYVGSQACATCHAQEADSWLGSHHALAWTEPSETSVLGDFNDRNFTHQGVTTRFSSSDGGYAVETDGPDGLLTTYEVLGVVGIAPLQQYLVEIEPGRQQALDTAWDTVANRWFHLYPDQQLEGGDGLHWTGPYKTWNARCAECHATGYEKAYDPDTRTYESHQAEIGVGCEACHGPGSEHVAWADGGSQEANFGLTAPFPQSYPEPEIQQCAGCHSRREPLGSDSPLPGTPFHDSYRLALLRPGLYHPDGSIQDEVYVYGSFLQSKMYAKGVRCTDCHNPHTAQLVADGNAVCTQCHSVAANPRFPSLRPVDYDDPAHHFHQPETPGAQCQSCHMIERTYMQVDGRRDHSFRIPRPDLSADTGAPSACIDCHSDREPAWAAAEIHVRFPDGRWRRPDFSSVFSAACIDAFANGGALLDIAEDPDIAGIVRATALEMLRDAANDELAARAGSLLSDADPIVRRAAVDLQRRVPLIDRVDRLAPLLEDPVRSVRIAAARAFIGAPVTRLPPTMAQPLRDAAVDFQASLRARADYPETHLVIGGTALIMRNLPAAEAAFREAVALDPQLEDAWSMIVRIRDANGDRAGARQALNEAMAVNPISLPLMMLNQSLTE